MNKKREDFNNQYQEWKRALPIDAADINSGEKECTSPILLEQLKNKNRSLPYSKISSSSK